MSDIEIKDTGRQLQDIPGESFSSFLKNAVDEVNRDPLQAAPSMKNYLSGRETNLCNTLLSLDKADLSFNLMMQVRQKLVDAYRQMQTPGLKT